MDSPGWLPPHAGLTFLADVNSSWLVMLCLTVFKIFVITWQKSVSARQKMVHLMPFFKPEFGAKGIATKRAEDTSGTQLLYHQAKFHDNQPHCRRDISPRTKTYSYSKRYICKYAILAYCRQKQQTYSKMSVITEGHSTARFCTLD